MPGDDYLGPEDRERRALDEQSVAVAWIVQLRDQVNVAAARAAGTVIADSMPLRPPAPAHSPTVKGLQAIGGWHAGHGGVLSSARATRVVS